MGFSDLIKAGVCIYIRMSVSGTKILLVPVVRYIYNFSCPIMELMTKIKISAFEGMESSICI